MSTKNKTKEICTPDEHVQTFNPPPGSFQKKLEVLINAHSIEGGSNTPDFILAEYLRQCLDAFDLATRKRSDWYGHIAEEYGLKKLDDIAKK